MRDEKPIDISYYLLLESETIIELASTGGSEPVSDSTDLSDQQNKIFEEDPLHQPSAQGPIQLASGQDIQHSYT